jgi:hypothetical protein
VQLLNVLIPICVVPGPNNILNKEVRDKPAASNLAFTSAWVINPEPSGIKVTSGIGISSHFAHNVIGPDVPTGTANQGSPVKPASLYQPAKIYSVLVGVCNACGSISG